MSDIIDQSYEKNFLEFGQNIIQLDGTSKSKVLIFNKGGPVILDSEGNLLSPELYFNINHIQIYGSDSKYASKEEIIEINKLIYTVIYIFASIFHENSDHTKDWCPKWSSKKLYMLGRLIWYFFNKKNSPYIATYVCDDKHCKLKGIKLHPLCDNLSDFWGEPLDPINFMIFVLNNLFDKKLTYTIEDDRKFIYEHVENGITKKVPGWTVKIGTEESFLEKY